MRAMIRLFKLLRAQHQIIGIQIRRRLVLAPFDF